MQDNTLDSTRCEFLDGSAGDVYVLPVLLGTLLQEIRGSSMPFPCNVRLKVGGRVVELEEPGIFRRQVLPSEMA